MKTKVLRRFKDKHSGVVYQKGDTLTISKERFDEILSVGPFVEEIRGATKRPKKTAE